MEPNDSKQRRPRIASVSLWVTGLTLAGVTLWLVTARPQLPAAERGRRLAERTGCYACHGPEGSHGSANPGRTDRTVPEYGDDLMMYAKTRQEVREWIRDGVTAARAKSHSWQEQRDRGALRMPAFKDRLSNRQIDDLVDFVRAAAGIPEPEDSLAALGLVRAQALGCTGCHGAGGRLARPNPGSLKGYVPSWDGPDFVDLVRDSSEFNQWVEHGISRRFDANPLARYFLRRAVLRMPAFERHLKPGDLGALWGYVGWLRTRGERDRPA
jgi:mono/diheme cytochrome c family protein